MKITNKSTSSPVPQETTLIKDSIKMSQREFLHYHKDKTEKDYQRLRSSAVGKGKSIFKQIE